MKKQTLLKILKNGGATLNARGKAVEYEGGYQVSFKDLYIIDLKNIDSILDAVNKALAEVGDSCVGIWVDAGLVYVDYSKKIDDLQEALQFGKSNNQLSVFNWNTKKCIFLAEV